MKKNNIEIISHGSQYIKIEDVVFCPECFSDVNIEQEYSRDETEHGSLCDTITTFHYYKCPNCSCEFRKMTNRIKIHHDNNIKALIGGIDIILMAIVMVIDIISCCLISEDYSVSWFGTFCNFQWGFWPIAIIVFAIIAKDN